MALVTDRSYQIVVAVCHPDDEAIWLGGLICELARFPFLKIAVICLSGRDPASLRPKEFEAACAVAGYAQGVVLGGPLRSALETLPETGGTLEEGLAALAINTQAINLLLTHSPYGDEHINPHHIQAHRELARWSKRANVPFGYFSCLPIPYFRHTPAIRELRRHGTLHLLNLSHCRSATSVARRTADAALRAYADCPRYYLQFLTDGAAKARMLACYASIGLAEHERGYTMFTNPCEAVYLRDELAFVPFAAVIAAMEVPGAPALIEQRGIAARARAKLARALARHSDH